MLKHRILYILSCTENNLDIRNYLALDLIFDSLRWRLHRHASVSLLSETKSYFQGQRHVLANLLPRLCRSYNLPITYTQFQFGS